METTNTTRETLVHDKWTILNPFSCIHENLMVMYVINMQVVVYNIWTKLPTYLG